RLRIVTPVRPASMPPAHPSSTGTQRREPLPPAVGGQRDCPPVSQSQPPWPPDSPAAGNPALHGAHDARGLALRQRYQDRNAIPMHSKIFDAMTALKTGASRSRTSATSHRRQITAILSLG